MSKELDDLEATAAAMAEDQLKQLSPKLQKVVRDIIQVSNDYDAANCPGWAWVSRNGYVSWQSGYPADRESYFSIRLPQGEGTSYFALEIFLNELEEFLQI
jgi:hypothetical protein